MSYHLALLDITSLYEGLLARVMHELKLMETTFLYRLALYGICLSAALLITASGRDETVF